VGSSGNDTLIGLGGNDVLNGGTGADSMVGGAGNDTYFVDSYSDQVVELAGQGVDTIVTTLSAYSIFGNVHVENLTGQTGAGHVLTGNTGANVITGGGGNDRLIGSGGDDTLIGGAGEDTLEGGSGADVFVFNSAPGAGNVDVIVDFSVAEDRIHLENAIFTALGAAGGLSAAAFHTGTGAATAAHRVVYEAGTGALFYDADGSGAGGQVQIATLSAGLGLTSAEFTII
jgi:Ca2+-binding RTX toxin-like protein